MQGATCLGLEGACANFGVHGRHARHHFQPHLERPRPPVWLHIHGQKQIKRTVQAQAKKKGGGGGKQKKGPGSLMDPPKPANPYQETDVIMQNLLMVESFHRKVGRPIMDGANIEDIAELLWKAPYAIMTHDLTEEPAKYDYANKVALDLFQASWDELVGQQSDCTNQHAGTDKEDRHKLLAVVKEKGTAPVEKAWRTGLKGRPICLNDAVMWNIEDPTGELLGQGIAIHEWEFEDGTTGGPNAEAKVTAQQTAETSAQSLQQAEQQVQEQADRVRQMKEVDGYEKGDPVLDEAVSELLQRKEVLQKLQQ